MANVVPFPFEQLKQVSAADVWALSRLAQVFPGHGLEPPVVGVMAQVLGKYLGPQTAISFESHEELSFEKWTAQLPENPVILVISLTPLTKKIIITLPLDLTFALVDKVLGGNAKPGVQGRKLSLMEEGVLEFLVVSSLAGLTQVLVAKNYQFRLDKIVSSVEAVKALEEAQARLIESNFTLRVGQAEGVVHLMIPQAMLSEMDRLGKPFFDEAQMTQSALKERRFKLVGDMKTVLWAEVGEVTLTPEDMAQLERGDIVMLDESYPEMRNKQLQGNLLLKLGDGSHGGLKAQIEATEDLYRLTLRSVVD